MVESVNSTKKMKNEDNFLVGILQCAELNGSKTDIARLCNNQGSARLPCNMKLLHVCYNQKNSNDEVRLYDTVIWRNIYRYGPMMSDSARNILPHNTVKSRI